MRLYLQWLVLLGRQDDDAGDIDEQGPQIPQESPKEWHHLTIGDVQRATDCFPVLVRQFPWHQGTTQPLKRGQILIYHWQPKRLQLVRPRMSNSNETHLSHNSWIRINSLVWFWRKSRRIYYSKENHPNNVEAIPVKMIWEGGNSHSLWVGRFQSTELFGVVLGLIYFLDWRDSK